MFIYRIIYEHSSQRKFAANVMYAVSNFVYICILLLMAQWRYKKIHCATNRKCFCSGCL